MIEFSFETHAFSYPAGKLAKAARAVLNEYLDDESILYDINLSLIEALSNVVKHAYEESDPGPVRLIIGFKYGDYVDFQITDWGRGFPKLPFDVKNAEPEAECGRGLYIISELADEFNIIKDNDANTIYFKVKTGEGIWKPLK